MLDFSLMPYEWQRDMEIIMSNVNLNSIEFLSAKNMSFSFLNSYNGDFYKKILCHNVWRLSEGNIIDEGEEFPTFVCDIRVKKLKNVEIKAAFDYLKYGWDVPVSNEYNLVCIDGGEISIDLICGKIEVLDM